MAKPVVMSYSRLFSTDQARAFDSVLPTALPELFHRRYGPIPPIRSVEEQDGVWGTVGQTRTIHLADGGSMCEELTRVERPASFAYTITGLTGPMKPLAALILGSWTFDEDAGQTRVTWQWTITPKSALAAPIMPIFRRLWRGYASRTFDQIGVLVRS